MQVVITSTPLSLARDLIAQVRRKRLRLHVSSSFPDTETEHEDDLVTAATRNWLPPELIPPPYMDYAAMNLLLDGEGSGKERSRVRRTSVDRAKETLGW